MAGGSVTKLFPKLINGDAAAQTDLVHTFLDRLVRLACKKLQRADADAVAVNVLRSFLSGVQKNRFTHLPDRAALWALLAWMTARKVIDEYRKQAAFKRASIAGGLQNDESAASDGDILGRIAVDEADPAIQVALDDLIDHMLRRLPDEETRSMALDWLRGCSAAESAEHHNKSRRTVERRRFRMLTAWQGAVG
jgi:DNA-directed RNA polymerase specialized sigma24 family protein